MSGATVISSDDWLRFQPSPMEELVFKLTGSQSQNQLELVQVTIQPGGGPPIHIHEQQDEVLQVLEGSLLFRQGEEVLTLSAGDTVFTRRGIPHAYFNESDGVVSAAGVFTPAGFLEFMQGSQELMSGGPPAPDAFEELGRRTGVRMVGPPLGASKS